MNKLSLGAAMGVSFLISAAGIAQAHDHAQPVGGSAMVMAQADAGDNKMAGMDMAAPVKLGDLEISGPFARATLPNQPVAGGYVTITNNGSAADRLVSVTSPAAAMVQIHEMAMEGDVMKMRELPDGLEIPAGQSVALSPGGLHLMFMKLNGPFEQGSKVPVTLNFEKAGSVEVELPVMPANAEAPAGHDQMKM